MKRPVTEAEGIGVTPARRGADGHEPGRRQEFSTQFVDVGRGQLLDVVPGRSNTEPMVWLVKKGKAWLKPPKSPSA